MFDGVLTLIIHLLVENVVHFVTKIKEVFTNSNCMFEPADRLSLCKGGYVFEQRCMVTDKTQS